MNGTSNTQKFCHILDGFVSGLVSVFLRPAHKQRIRRRALLCVPMNSRKAINSEPNRLAPGSRA